MPRKKKFNLEDKLYSRLDDKLIKGLKDYKEPALRPSTVAQFQKWDFTPLWEYTDRETLIVFTRWLSKSPVFEKDKFGKIHLRGYARCYNVPLLLFGLSGELANFFLSQQSGAKSYIKLLRKPFSIVEDLRGYKSKLISLGIVKNEDTFDEVYLKIENWMEKFVMRSVESIPSVKKSTELEVALYPYLKSLTRLRHGVILNYIACIKKHLGLEKGDVKRISEKIRKRTERKGIKKALVTKTLDIEQLRKTLRRLIFKN